MDFSKNLSAQLKWMQLLLDPDSGAILFRQPTLRGVPDLVVEGDGYTLEFIGPPPCSASTSRIQAAWLVS
jgi:hypothetical protein